LKILC